MKTILPYTTPKYKTYNYMCALDVCGQEDIRMDNWYLDRYIFWRYVLAEDCIHIIKSGVFGDLPFMYQQNMWKRHIKDYYKNIFKALLDDEFYVYFTNIDEYYIPDTIPYNKYHFPHDGLIYGYDEEESVYYYAAYDKSGYYNNFKILMADFDKAWYSKYNRSSDEDVSEGLLKGLKLEKGRDYNADFNQILIDLKSYADSKCVENGYNAVYGMNVYKEIDKKINATIKGETVFKDKRLLRILSEHKLAMKKRFEYLYKNSIISQDMLKDYDKVYDLAEITRMVHLKYSLTNNQKLLCKIKDNINRICDEEYRLLNKIK